MLEISSSVHVSLAYRLENGAILGGNWRLEVGVACDFEPALDAALTELKSLVDHRCLWTDVDVFKERDSSVPAVAGWLAERLFREYPETTFLTVHENPGHAVRFERGGATPLTEIQLMNLRIGVRAARVDKTTLTQAVKEAWGRELWGEALVRNLSAQVKGLAWVEARQSPENQIRWTP